MIKIDYWEIAKNLWALLKATWPLILLMAVVPIMTLIFDILDLEINNWHIRRKFKKGEQWRNDRDLIQWLRSMNPTEFEFYIADLFRRLGYETEQVGGSGDGGIDVIAKKDGKTHLIQCKKYYSRHQVGSPEIRDFYGALAGRLGSAEGWFITTNKFTPEAEKFAEDKPIVLINQFDLIKYIRSANDQGVIADEKPQTNSVCPLCGSYLIEKFGKFGAFYGCSNYPRCKYTASK